MNAVYEFLGYRVCEIFYKSDFKKENSHISISILDDNFSNDVYSLIIKVSSDFSEEESSFVFEVAFLIKDKKWFESIESEKCKSVFFSVAFPFIREKILSITTDTRPGLLIPILDIRNVDFSKELTLSKKN